MTIQEAVQITVRFQVTTVEIVAIVAAAIVEAVQVIVAVQIVEVAAAIVAEAEEVVAVGTNRTPLRCM